MSIGLPDITLLNDWNDEYNPFDSAILLERRTDEHICDRETPHTKQHPPETYTLHLPGAHLHQYTQIASMLVFDLLERGAESGSDFIGVLFRA